MASRRLRDLPDVRLCLRRLDGNDGRHRYPADHLHRRLASIAQYAIYGYVFYTLAMGMLLGSLIGIQVGALTTKVVKGIHIRGFYAISIIAGFVNRVSTLPKKFTELEVVNFPKAFNNGIETSATSSSGLWWDSSDSGSSASS